MAAMQGERMRPAIMAGRFCLGGATMDRLVRIKSVDKFRFFSSYRWNNSLKPFDRFNLIYGWNGCGKSTLCDFFHAIEERAELPSQCAFQLCFQKNGNPENVVTLRTAATVANRFKVYHQYYAQGLISHPDSVKHISIIGHGAGEAVARIDVLKKEQIELEGTLTALKSEATTITREFEAYRKERATLVRSVTSYLQSYNYNKIYERYKQIKSPQELTQEEYDRLTVAVHATQKASIALPTIVCLNEIICNDVMDVLSESPSFKAIKELQEDANLRSWVQHGYELHKDAEVRVCEFCRNPIGTERWNDLESYFNDSLKKFKRHVETVICQLNTSKTQYVNYLAQLPHQAQLFDEFSAEYEELKSRAGLLCETYTSFIEKAIKLIQVKSDKIVDTQSAIDFTDLLATVDFNHSIVDDIKTLIGKHNSKAEDFQKSIEKDEERLELHIIAQSAPQFVNYESRLSKNNLEQRTTTARIAAIKSEIAELDSQVKNSRIPAGTINADIGFILGHSDLHFEWKENGYEIRRSDEIATCLSTGEQNAIALIYFFNSLQDSNISKENCIVILDDPVSSFDSNYYYSAAAYIRDKLQSVGQAFILTHKFSLYKDFSRMFSECNHYLLERESNKPVIKEEDTFLREYQDEYVYLFNKIYHFVKSPPDNFGDYLPYPNMGRRLIEGFTSFKIPGKKDILEKAIELDGDGNTARVRAITRLVQNQSHLRLVGSHDSVDNIFDIQQLPEIFRHLLEFIEAHDPIHYDMLIKQVDPELGIEENVSPEVQERTIPLFDLPVSAGFGNRMDTYEPSEPYHTTNSSADFALKISGDSMEPHYCNGDIVLIKKQETLENAQIGIVSVDDEVFCKKIITTGDTPLLISLNSAYSPRCVVAGEQFAVLGIVIDVVKQDDASD